jgi:hypothetical protein
VTPSAPEVTVVLPDGFTVLAVDGAEVDPDPIPAVASPFDAMRPFAASLSSLDVGLSAVGLHVLPAGGVGHTWLTLSCLPMESSDPERTADGIAMALREDEVDVRRLRLPAGEAVSVTYFGRRELTVDEGPPAVLETGTLQVQLPMQGYDRVLVLTVESTALEAWVNVCRTAAEIAKSLAWTAPEL